MLSFSFLALYLLIFIDFFEISIPVPLNFFLSLNIDNKIHPEPVPISRICNFESSSEVVVKRHIEGIHGV